jgi:AraC-like DNA-binding protein
MCVIFRPGGAAPFLRLPLAELRNQVVSLDAIWGGAAAEIGERLAEAPTPQARLALFERLLLARLGQVSHRRGPARGPAIALTQHAVAAIARSHGALSIRALSAHLGVSHKHLITHFHELVGTTPKALARVYRLNRVLDHLDPDAAHPDAWTQVAHQAGYYDGAHFNREFRAFTGQTPTDFLRLLRQVRVELPEYKQYPKFLPTG